MSTPLSFSCASVPKNEYLHKFFIRCLTNIVLNSFSLTSSFSCEHCLYIYIYIYVHEYIHTYIHTYIQAQKLILCDVIKTLLVGITGIKESFIP